MNHRAIMFYQTSRLAMKKSIISAYGGQRYRKYLKQNHKVLYYNYLTSGKLYEHLSEVDSRAETMFNALVKSFAEKENVTEQLKATTPMVWVQQLNNIRSRASEIVWNELLV